MKKYKYSESENRFVESDDGDFEFCIIQLIARKISATKFILSDDTEITVQNGNIIREDVMPDEITSNLPRSCDTGNFTLEMSNMGKKITAEAKRIRNENPKIKWKDAMKQAGKNLKVNRDNNFSIQT
jgi:hypothetical protein